MTIRVMVFVQTRFFRLRSSDNICSTNDRVMRPTVALKSLLYRSKIVSVMKGSKFSRDKRMWILSIVALEFATGHRLARTLLW